MPTTDERREVAARLRGKRPRACVRGVLGWELACGDFECCEDCSRFAMSDLADLIEPSERTCHVMSTIQREYYIEGQTVFEYETELSCGHKFTDSYGDAPNYCPNCGCRVKEIE